MHATGKLLKSAFPRAGRGCDDNINMDVIKMLYEEHEYGPALSCYIFD
jgi:hypothetical protein